MLRQTISANHAADRLRHSDRRAVNDAASRRNCSIAQRQNGSERSGKVWDCRLNFTIFIFGGVCIAHGNLRVVYQARIAKPASLRAQRSLVYDVEIAK